MDLKHVTDRVLLKDTKALVMREREVTTTVLHHFREIERRRLFSDLGYSSLFEYCKRELGYSEAAASRRIHAARLMGEIPEIERKIQNGSLNLTNIASASRMFKEAGIKGSEEKKIILDSIENKSTRESGMILAGLLDNPLPPEKVRPIANDVYSINLNITGETLSSWHEIKNLLGHRKFNNDQLLNHIINLAMEVVRNQRFKVNSVPPAAPKSTLKRYIPDEMKKAVYERDLGKCQKCGGTYKIEFDHVLPHSMGGMTSKENLRLLCFSCNQRERIKANL